MFLMICGFWMLLFIENQKSEYTSFAYFTSFLTRRLRKQFKGFNGGADYKQLLDEICDIQNNQGRGRGYRDLDHSGYHKNRI